MLSPSMPFSLFFNFFSVLELSYSGSKSFITCWELHFDRRVIRLRFVQVFIFWSILNLNGRLQSKVQKDKSWMQF